MKYCENLEYVMNNTNNGLKIQKHGEKRNKRSSTRERKVSSHHHFVICPKDIKKTIFPKNSPQLQGGNK
jgi:hypothetical protein